MKINKIGLVLTIVIGAVVLGGCGSANENAPVDQPQEETSNAENVRAVVEAISDPEVRYKIVIDNESHVLPLLDDFFVDGTSYGFDDPYTSTSIYAYAEQKGLNDEQARAIDFLLSPSAEDENGKELRKIMEYYPEDFSKGSYPYKGADLDYMTLSNIDTEPTDKEGYTKITADVTVHLHLVDGTEEERTYKTFAVPKAGETPLDADKVDRATSADKMNEEIPTEDRFIYVDKPE